MSMDLGVDAEEDVAMEWSVERPGAVEEAGHLEAQLVQRPQHAQRAVVGALDVAWDSQSITGRRTRSSTAVQAAPTEAQAAPTAAQSSEALLEEYWPKLIDAIKWRPNPTFGRLPGLGESMTINFLAKMDTDFPNGFTVNDTLRIARRDFAPALPGNDLPVEDFKVISAREHHGGLQQLEVQRTSGAPNNYELLAVQALLTVSGESAAVADHRAYSLEMLPKLVGCSRWMILWRTNRGPFSAVLKTSAKATSYVVE